MADAQRRASGIPARFAGELLLYSGQYALFYIVMNFSHAGVGYFGNVGHTLLLFILVAQTVALVLYGDRPLGRFLFSLLAPAVYTAIEFTTEGLSFVLNMGHMFFWLFSGATGAFQAFSRAGVRKRTRYALEFASTTLNVAVFIVVYFYFDVKLALASALANGAVSQAEYLNNLEIGHFAASFRGFLTDPAHVYLLIAGLILAASLGIGRVRILQLKERIADLFGRYVDGTIRDRIIDSGEAPNSEKREVAILFSDIRGFTPIAESSTPDELTRMLNRYFTTWNRIVRRRHGVVDKYIGDAIMVIFGLERPEKAADDAVRTAFEMLDELPELRRSLIEAGLPVIEAFGVGINYGEVVFGDIGSEERRNYTVVGDVVNVASRLESQSKSEGRTIIISDTVYPKLSDENKRLFEVLGHVELKGKHERVLVYGLTRARCEPASSQASS